MAEPVTDVESLKQFIRDRTKATWDERRGPYYLSFVGTELSKLGVNYRDIIGPFTLVQWASSTDFTDTKVVSHPRHKAKVGFVPSQVDFSFKDETAGAPDPSAVSAYSTSRVRTMDGRRGRALLSFVENLANLSDDALQDFHVPAKALVQLLKS